MSCAALIFILASIGFYLYIIREENYISNLEDLYLGLHKKRETI